VWRTSCLNIVWHCERDLWVFCLSNCICHGNLYTNCELFKTFSSWEFKYLNSIMMVREQRRHADKRPQCKGRWHGVMSLPHDDEHCPTDLQHPLSIHNQPRRCTQYSPGNKTVKNCNKNSVQAFLYVLARWKVIYICISLFTLQVSFSCS